MRTTTVKQHPCPLDGVDMPSTKLIYLFIVVDSVEHEWVFCFFN